MSIKCPKCQHENPDDTIYCGKCGITLRPPEDISITKTLETPAQGLAPGSTFAGRYQIIEELGKGGMGAVYKALDTQINEEVAIKLIRPEIASDEKTLERFSNELKLARKIGHKNVCKMFHLDKEGEIPYISMEYLEGDDLKDLIRKKEKLTSEEAIGIAKQVCEGLVEAHSLGVVHRDLKPQNIMMEKEGSAKIMDFGIARSVEAPGVTATGVIIGTPDYISPEQAEGQEADHRSDIYSLGVILYEMVTGTVPFKGDTALSVALKHKSQLPLDPRKLNPDVSDDLARLILICMEKDRERRYQKAQVLLDDLRNIEEGLPLGTKVQPRRATFIQTLIRRKLLIPAITIILAAIVVAAYVVFRKPGPGLDPNRIVVAVFDNQTGDPAYDPIGRMAADYISQGLAKTGLIDIVPYMSVGQIYSRYEGEDPLNYLAQYTKAGTVVTGTYYLQGDIFRFQTQVTDAQKGKLLQALDPVSGSVKDPTVPIELLRQQLMTTLAVFFEPELKDYAGVIPVPASYEAYQEFLEAWEFFFSLEFEQAVEHCLRAIELDPKYVQPMTLAASAYINLGKYDEANTLISRVDGLSPKLTPMDRYLLDGVRALIRGDRYGVYHAWVQIADIAPTPNAVYNVGLFGIRINRPQEAVDLITPLDPEDPGVFNIGYWRDLTIAHHMLGNHKKELKIARRGRRQNPESYSTLGYEARALAALGKIKEVNELIDEILTLFPQRNPVSRMLGVSRELKAHGYREASLQVIGRALSWLESKTAEEKKTVGHRNQLAWVLYTAESWEEAQILFEVLHNENPDNIHWLARLGILAARRGDRDEALRISSLLEKIERPYLFGWHTGYRASIAALLGEKEHAMKLLQEALAQGATYDAFGYYYIHPNMDLEPLYDYPPFQELIKPKG